MKPRLSSEGLMDQDGGLDQFKRSRLMEPEGEPFEVDDEGGMSY